jgi:hypothetical protein
MVLSKRLDTLRALWILLGLLSPIVAPAGARVCGHVLANLMLLDTGHPVDPCVDALATMEAAVSTVTSYVTTVGLPVTAVIAAFAISLVSLFLADAISCQLFSPPPHTPPPKLEIA